MEKRLIHRRKFVVDPRYAVTAKAEFTTIYRLPPKGHPLYAQIGQIAMGWSSIEETLDACISTRSPISAQKSPRASRRK